ncbi:hypothetical protein NONO_c73590 [Nocardia nova SH22a]|uniref:Uncharacterized protein n=1 Tax=Nocardia nova SH22a TaxID=1415166 RepID=W5TRV2_9NOCA|nr:hypothetical protein [Nocardia nova]AHH22115.1 hypothetical protein NONO_c73590 [Nocardia nova SH22a]
MTAPDGSSPAGSLGVGLFAARQAATVDDAKAEMVSGTIDTYTIVQNRVGTELRAPTSAAQAAAGTALTQAQAAVNAAANAGELADIAYANANDWQLEFVHSSAEVTLATGEVLVGPMLNVRDGQRAIMTDVHAAFLEQHDGVEFETRIWDAENTAYRVAHTATIEANVTRRHFSALSVDVDDLERFWSYVNEIIGTDPPTVLQICVAGVFIEDTESE